MVDYKIAQAYVAAILLFEVCSSIKLFGYLHGENLHLANDGPTLAIQSPLASFTNHNEISSHTLEVIRNPWAMEEELPVKYQLLDSGKYLEVPYKW